LRQRVSVVRQAATKEAKATTKQSMEMSRSLLNLTTE